MTLSEVYHYHPRSQGANERDSAAGAQRELGALEEGPAGQSDCCGETAHAAARPWVRWGIRHPGLPFFPPSDLPLALTI